MAYGHGDKTEKKCLKTKGRTCLVPLSNDKPKPRTFSVPEKIYTFFLKYSKSTFFFCFRSSTNFRAWTTTSVLNPKAQSERLAWLRPLRPCNTSRFTTVKSNPKVGLHPPIPRQQQQFSLPLTQPMLLASAASIPPRCRLCAQAVNCALRTSFTWQRWTPSGTRLVWNVRSVGWN